jgi:ribosomal protein L29
MTKQLKTLKNLSAAELAKKARELEAGLFGARFKKSTGQLASPADLWKMRKELARVKTLQTAANGAKGK